MTIYINIAFEDELHQHVIHKIISTLTVRRFEVLNEYTRGGNGYLRTRASSYNQAAVFTPFLMLTDLDQEICPIALISQWLGTAAKHPRFLFRVAVREVESWLLADKDAISSYFGIGLSHLQFDTETIRNPKEKLIELASKSRKQEIKKGIIPIGTAVIGKEYNILLGKYIRDYWSPSVARRNSESLDRMIRSLENY